MQTRLSAKDALRKENGNRKIPMGIFSGLSAVAFLPLPFGISLVGCPISNMILGYSDVIIFIALQWLCAGIVFAIIGFGCALALRNLEWNRTVWMVIIFGMSFNVGSLPLARALTNIEQDRRYSESTSNYNKSELVTLYTAPVVPPSAASE